MPIISWLPWIPHILLGLIVWYVASRVFFTFYCYANLAPEWNPLQTIQYKQRVTSRGVEEYAIPRTTRLILWIPILGGIFMLQILATELGTLWRMKKAKEEEYQQTYETRMNDIFYDRKDLFHQAVEEVEAVSNLGNYVTDTDSTPKAKANNAKPKKSWIPILPQVSWPFGKDEPVEKPKRKKRVSKSKSDAPISVAIEHVDMVQPLDKPEATEEEKDTPPTNG